MSRKNPSILGTLQWTMVLGVVGVGGYFVYTLLKSATGATGAGDLLKKGGELLSKPGEALDIIGGMVSEAKERAVDFVSSSPATFAGNMISKYKPDQNFIGAPTTLSVGDSNAIRATIVNVQQQKVDGKSINMTETQYQHLIRILSYYEVSTGVDLPGWKY